MKVERLNAETVRLYDLNLLLTELLHQIPVSADTGDSIAADARLYPSPMSRPEPEFDEDWRTYVRPELEEKFHTALDVVRQDLAEFPPDTPAEAYELQVPVAHLESWLSALNQARLALAARNEFTEKELEKMPREGDARALALFQMQVYGVIQEWFIRELEA